MIDVAIIGAGVSGLAVAWKLRAAGKTVRIVEARDRLGGRAFTHRDHGVDLGATWVWDTETTVRAVLDELGVATVLCERKGLDTYDDGTVQRGRLPGSSVTERRIVGGMRSLVEALAEHAGPVELELEVKGLERTERGVRVRCETPFEAKHVLVALPPSLVADWLEEPWIARVPVWMGTVAKCVGVFESPVWSEQGLSGRAFSRIGPMTEVHDLSGPGVNALFGFAHREHADDLEHRVTEQFERLFGARPAHLICQRWWDERFTTANHPEDQRLFAHPKLREPFLDERVHLISCETSAVSPGHIDGALERALNVARRIT